ncbi:MAG: hypothetical protein OIF34_03105, partial [Porticoccaceae bacterium]|nr:hypothetical protein [Porticoccaceae bacterium]
MKNLLKTVALFSALIFAGAVAAASGGHNHGAMVELGEQLSPSWQVSVQQFGTMSADSSQLTCNIVVRSNGGQLGQVEALRLWFGDVDSDSAAIKLSFSKLDEALFVHGHIPMESG